MPAGEKRDGGEPLRASQREACPAPVSIGRGTTTLVARPPATLPFPISPEQNFETLVLVDVASSVFVAGRRHTDEPMIASVRATTPAAIRHRSQAKWRWVDEGGLENQPCHEVNEVEESAGLSRQLVAPCSPVKHHEIRPVYESVGVLVYLCQNTESHVNGNDERYQDGSDKRFGTCTSTWTCTSTLVPRQANSVGTSPEQYHQWN